MTLKNYDLKQFKKDSDKKIFSSKWKIQVNQIAFRFLLNQTPCFYCHVKKVFLLEEHLICGSYVFSLYYTGIVYV